ncbi:MAG: hypothetical protein QM813_24990 [Verrucomicrobiota bacterium]
MSADRQQAIQYLRAPAHGLWRWAEDGKVLTWNDGSTIAFREEIVQILEWLAPHGLPPFGAVAFLLAACRGKVAKVDEVVAESNTPLPTKMGDDAAVLLSARRQLRMQLEAALVQLAKVSQLPSELNTGLKARCILAEAVFEPAKAERHVETETVLRGMREPAGDADLVNDSSPNAAGSYIRQIHIVAEGLKLHTAESLALRLRTGLDALPKEVDVELPSAERARRLIQELSKDRDCGAVARAARELLAAVRLPRRLGEHEQLSLGGVADITNRGPLDRLLLSELAHDDLTLATRVALNEALYLRREPPMREPPGTLALLLDSGVRLWGIPRVLATAVALALIARDKQHSQVLSWRAHGKELKSLDLLSRNGLTQHLGTLETDAHPGASLPAFAEAIEEGARHQSVLITHHDCLDDPEFRRSLAAHPAVPGFVATVDRVGHFELHALPLARRPAICEADLDLADVFDETTGTSLVRADLDPSLPAIFGIHPLPFLLPIAGKMDFWHLGMDGFVCATLNDRRLIRFRDQQTGARILAAELPGGRTVWMDCVDGVVHVIKSVASQRPARLLSYPLPDGPLQVVDLVAGEDVLAVHRYGGVILLIRRTDVRAYALSDGQMVGKVLNPHRWANGRFFRGEKHYYFAAWDGQMIKFEAIQAVTSLYHATVLIFDREGMEGPFVLLRVGEVLNTATGDQTALKHPINTLNFSQTAASRTGHHLAVASRPKDSSGTPSGPARMFDLRNGQSFEFRIFPPQDFPGTPGLPVWNVFRVVESLARLDDGLAICGRRGRWRKLTLDSDAKLKITELRERGSELLSKVSFTGQPKPTQQICTLQTAEWPCGSKAFLDNRGLLHLKSHDPQLPEISLVLADGEVAAWTSDGFVCGPAFFFEDAHRFEPERVFEQLIQFLVKL